MSERLVLCEGYHDRAFWAGALVHLGCIDPGAIPSGRRPVLDPQGKRVTAGEFGFNTGSGNFVRVRPCGGKTTIVPVLKTVLEGLATRPFDRVVVNWDDDGDVRTTSPRNGFPLSLRSIALAIDPKASMDASGDLVVGATRLSATAWWTSEAHTASLPWQQTLERLVCAAIDAAYVGRGLSVGQWLAGMPGTDAPKPHAWSHMAGWYADHGCEGFFRLIWEDARIVAELRLRLEACGAWRLLQEIAA